MNTPSPRSSPPIRPKSWDQVGFEPQPFVRWFHPAELLRAGLYTLLSSLFGSFADKRELQAALNRPDRSRFTQYAGEAPDGDFWLDFVADIGDGFDATYSVAYLLAQERLDVEGLAEATPRGRILLMGGDEVYPVASRKSYQDRSVGPYRAALPYIEDESRCPHLYAIPGNHDWYDGLSAFIRQFAQRDGRWIGAWRTQQRRSYFARKLPRSCWLWGVDVQLHADIDSPQSEYFETAAGELAAGDRVILLTAEPSWVKEAEGEHAGYQSLLRLMELVTGQGARVAVVVTGDSHHYAHYVDVDARAAATHFITAGGGGAFLHGTHTLPQWISLPNSSDPAAVGDRRHLKRLQTFPTPDESRQLIRRGLPSFPLKNRAFALVWLGVWAWLGLLLWTDGESPARGGSADIVQRLSGTLGVEALHSRLPLLALIGGTFLLVMVARAWAGPASGEHASVEEADAATQGHRSGVGWRTVADLCLWLAIVFALGALATAAPGPMAEPDGSSLSVLWHSLATNLSAAVLVVLVPLASALYVSRPLEWGWAWAGRMLLGWIHGTLYVLAWLLVASVCARASEALGWGNWVWLITSSVISAATSTLLFAGSLWFGGQYQRALLNDAFSAIGVQDYRNFLRLKIDAAGELTIFAVGLRRVVHHWRLEPKGAPSAPHIVPEQGEALVPHLIEAITIPAGARPATPTGAVPLMG